MYDQEKLRQARQMIGDTPHKRLEWLIEFLSSEPWKLSDEAREELRYGLQALAEPTQFCAYPADAWPLPERELSGLWGELKEAVSLMSDVSHGETYWPLPATGTLTAVRAPDGTVTPLLVAGPKDAIRAGVILLLAQAGQHLRVCESCGTPFAGRPNREYCSERCSQRVRNRRRYHAESPELAPR